MFLNHVSLINICLSNSLALTLNSVSRIVQHSLLKLSLVLVLLITSFWHLFSLVISDNCRRNMFDNTIIVQHKHYLSYHTHKYTPAIAR